MAKILVTGANGYIGTHVVNYLSAHTSHTVLATDIQNTYVPGNVSFIPQDILTHCHEPSLYQQLGSPDILVHLAWQDGFKHNAASHVNNLPKHLAFLQNLIEHGTRNVSVMGTMHEVGFYEGQVSDVLPPPTHPMSLYAIAKNALRQALFTLYAGKPDISLKWLRGFYITGDDARSHSIFSKIIQWEREGKTSFPFTDGTARYDFTDIDTFAKMVALASLSENRQEIINICSGTPVSLKEKVESFLKMKQFRIRPEYGAFPKRKYDSAVLYGSADKIRQIIREAEHEPVS